MDLMIGDHIAVVIGGAGGIGQAIVERFLEAGARVVIADRTADVHSLANSWESRYGSHVLPHVVDATRYGDIVAMLERVNADWGPLDHLIVAIGSGSGKFGDPFWNLSPHDWPAVIEQNLLGVVNAAHAAVPWMIARRSGTMLFLSSVAGQIGSTTDPPYSAAKAAVINFGQCAARDLARYDIRVNVLSPGMVQTGLNRQVHHAWQMAAPARTHISYEEWAAEKIARVTPLNRWQTPADIADMAVFLASARARNITGQTLNVDGGQVMHS